MGPESTSQPRKIRVKTRLSLSDMPAGFVEALAELTEERPALVAYFQTEPLPTWAERNQS